MNADQATNARRIEINGRSFVVDGGRIPAFWNLLEAGTWEPETFAVLDRMVRPGTTYVDCGAWIGPTVLYAASLGAAVTAFECDPVALADLRRNLALNPALAGRVTVIDAALNDRDGPVVVQSQALGNSATTVFDVVERSGERQSLDDRVTVRGLDARHVFGNAGWLADPDALIKIDVEGAEYAILTRLGSDLDTARCSLFVSFHPFNVVSADSRPDRLLRLRSTLEWMDRLWDYEWWAWSDEGASLQRLDKSVILASELASDGRTLYRSLTDAGKGLPGILFSRRDDLDAGRSLPGRPGS